MKSSVIDNYQFKTPLKKGMFSREKVISKEKSQRTLSTIRPNTSKEKNKSSTTVVNYEDANTSFNLFDVSM